MNLQRVWRIGTGLFWIGCLLQPFFVSAEETFAPFQWVRPGDPLYERAERLAHDGFLGEEARGVFETRKPVTRLQLAFYVEKAKPKFSEPLLPTPVPKPQAPPEPIFEEPADVFPPPEPVPQQPPAPREDWEVLRKALRAESQYLRTRISILNQQYDDVEKELESIEKIQGELDAISRKANKQGGSPNFSSNSRWTFEDFTLRNQTSAPASTVSVQLPDGSGSTPVTQQALTNQRATRFDQEYYLGVWADLGGKGSVSSGVNAFLPSSTNGEPVSVGIGRPSVDLWLDGRLGHWDILIRDESFIPDSSLGMFVRSVNRTTPRRFEDIYHVRVFSDNKLKQLWDDYMGSLGYTVTRSLVGGNVQSQDDRVFDGVVFKGQNVPGFGPARLHALVGRLLEGQRFEYGAKVTRPFWRNKAEAWVAAYFVDDTFGTGQDPAVDMRNYAAAVAVDLSPFVLNVESARSHFFSGQDLQNPAGAVPITASGGRASLGFYPFTFFFTNVSPDYANFQSHVTNTSIDYSRYGIADDGTALSAGDIGEADMVHSNRKSYRLNFGWQGRKKNWLRKLPAFLDDMVINFDWTLSEEYRAIADANKRYVVEAWNMVSPYYDEGEGIWGKFLYGGFPGNAVDSALSLRQQYIRNVQAARGFQLAQAEVTYRFRFTSERYPLVDPQTGENLSHLKTYRYLALTPKIRLNRWLKLSKPIYLGAFLGDNKVSGKAQEAGQTDIPELFRQRMVDVSFFLGDVLPKLHLVAHMAYEEHKSRWTVPGVFNMVRNPGVGFGYDIPWGTSKLEMRFDHVEFRSAGVPSNNYNTEQFFALLKMLF